MNMVERVSDCLDHFEDRLNEALKENLINDIYNNQYSIMYQRSSIYPEIIIDDSLNSFIEHTILAAVATNEAKKPYTAKDYFVSRMTLKVIIYKDMELNHKLCVFPAQSKKGIKFKRLIKQSETGEYVLTNAVKNSNNKHLTYLAIIIRDCCNELVKACEESED